MTSAVHAKDKNHISCVSELILISATAFSLYDEKNLLPSALLVRVSSTAQAAQSNIKIGIELGANLDGWP